MPAPHEAVIVLVLRAVPFELDAIRGPDLQMPHAWARLHARTWPVQGASSDCPCQNMVSPWLLGAGLAMTGVLRLGISHGSVRRVGIGVAVPRPRACVHSHPCARARVRGDVGTDQRAGPLAQRLGDLDGARPRGATVERLLLPVRQRRIAGLRLQARGASI